MNHKYTIYRINFPDGKTYVGCTKNYKKRMYDHLTNPINIYSEIQIMKYGEDAINSEILADDVPDHLKNAVEKYFILKEGDRATNRQLPDDRKELEYERICRLINKAPFQLFGHTIVYDAIINNKKTGMNMRELMKLTS